MEVITIKSVGPGHCDVLVRLGRQTFYETFAENNKEETIQSYLVKSFSPEKIAGEISDPDSYFFIAYANDVPVGYLKLNTGKAQTELQDMAALEIERIYVLKEYHGAQVGQKLFAKALDMARKLNKGFIWLGVWEQNGRAVRFYEKNGFLPFDTHVFMMGDEAQTDIMMKKIV